MNSEEFDLKMTRRALELAAEGVGQVSPGPLVGCVIVGQDGSVVGEGSYFFDRMTHAEVVALQAAGEASHGGTAYISLEPHSHHGRTPPCTEALIKAGIKRVVVPVEDPNPLVSGKGFELLRERGIAVQTGLLKEEAETQNEKFFHWHRTGLPFVHMKSASSLDGKCATRTGESQWITSEASRERGQALRHEYDAILVGRRTAEKDNPRLTDRSGIPRRRKLIRVVLDNELSLNEESKLASTADEIPTIIFCAGNADQAKIESLQRLGIEVVRQNGGGNNLKAVLSELARRDVQSLLVEGGPSVAGSFVESGFVDKVTFFVAPVIIGGADAISAIGGDGVARLADALVLKNVCVRTNGGDLEITGYPQTSKNESGE